MAFELFDNMEKKQFHSPVITITKTGMLYINKPCYNQYFDRAGFVALYFDKAERRIGIKPEKHSSATARKIYFQKANGGKNEYVMISVRSFLRHYGIDWKVKKRYVPYQSVEVKDMIELLLDDPFGENIRFETTKDESEGA